MVATLPTIVVRCPRCGSLDAGSVEPVGIEFDRMRCGACGHEQICDVWQISMDWTETVAPGRARSAARTLLPDDRFRAWWASLGAEGLGAEVLERLREAYDEPHRAYHTARHVGACLAVLDEEAVAALPERPAEVEAALWFHDAVYDTHAHDNEERSAAWAEECLAVAGVDPRVAARIGDHVRATRTHAAASSDGQLVVDIDLSILGAEDVVFDRFEEEIRLEYAWVEQAAFAAGRSAVLRRFLDRPAIYATALFRERHEARARANIARALEALA